jgi:hypothetical protein
MATTYTWGIHRLDFKTEENSLSKVIKTVTWRYTANNGVNEATHYGFVPVSAPDSDNFTQFESLTEEQVKSWIDNQLNHWAIKKGLDEELNRIANAPDARTFEMPWNSN